MLLVADSGSTKCDWLLIDGEKPFKRFSTIGFNPYFLNEAVISHTLRRMESLAPYMADVDRCYFYGAGCSSPELQQVVQRALYAVLPNSKVRVSHDLDAAAFATYTGEPSIACILGTGSNSCYFDGKQIREEVPALAYILGDEGGGAYYGKKLLADFLYGRLPQNIHQGLIDEFSLDKNSIMDNVYMKPHANVYLASFMRFIWGFKSEAYVQDMVSAGMKVFLQTHVCCFPEYRDVKTNFVGSVAHHFSEMLESAAKEMGVTIGQIEKKPIHGLVRFHQQHEESLI